MCIERKIVFIKNGRMFILVQNSFNAHKSVFKICFISCLMCFTLSLCNIKSAAFSPIIIVGAFVFPDVTVGITEASATLRL